MRSNALGQVELIIAKYVHQKIQNVGDKKSVGVFFFDI